LEPSVTVFDFAACECGDVIDPADFARTATNIGEIQTILNSNSAPLNLITETADNILTESGNLEQHLHLIEEYNDIVKLTESADVELEQRFSNAPQALKNQLLDQKQQLEQLYHKMLAVQSQGEDLFPGSNIQEIYYSERVQGAGVANGWARPQSNWLRLLFRAQPEELRNLELRSDGGHVT
jgi:hypothetical protein